MSSEKSFAPTILFPVTNRVHIARQQLLLAEIAKFATVRIVTFKPEGPMPQAAAALATEFEFQIGKPDAVLIRGDRYEMLPLAMIAAYKNVPIIHLEGGDRSGVIDNKVRHAITQLSDIHFVTNTESYSRVISMGAAPKTVFNHGSLDVEYAKSVATNQMGSDSYIVVLYHPIPGEDTQELVDAIKMSGLKAVWIGSNSDYTQRIEGDEYSPQEFIRLVARSACLVGNSSAGIKEASILGVSVVNVGSRQTGRLRPSNVVDVPCKRADILEAIKFQTHHICEPDFTYYQANTSKNIAKEIKRFTEERGCDHG